MLSESQTFIGSYIHDISYIFKYNLKSHITTVISTDTAVKPI